MEDPVLLALKTMEVSMAKEHRKPPEAGEGKEKLSPLDLPDRNAALPRPWF